MRGKFRIIELEDYIIISIITFNNSFSCTYWAKVLSTITLDRKIESINKL